MLSIVVPTLNEEKYLPLLFDSIKRQNMADYEIIVADAGSLDRTVELSENYGCRIVAGGVPSRGKNQGARAAKGDLILFIDADVILPDDFLIKNLKEFEKRNLDLASFTLRAKSNFHNFSFKFLFNFPSLIFEKILPQAMNIILIKNDIHKKIRGFNEEIKIGEELDYVRRGARMGKFGVLRSTKAISLPRRFQQDGWFATWLKYFLCQVHMIFLGPVKSDILRYKFNHYSESLKDSENLS